MRTQSALPLRPYQRVENCKISTPVGVEYLMVRHPHYEAVAITREQLAMHRRQVAHTLRLARYRLKRRVEGAAPLEPCGICGRGMDDPADPLSANCGGDCGRCMADAGDPTWVRAVARHARRR